MKTTHPTLTRRAAIAGALMLVAAHAAAQVSTPVRLIVGYAAGGPVDTTARLFAPVFARELGTQVIVENRPGASGNVAGASVAKSAPDGLTLFFAASPTITISPNIYKKMPFDPATELTPVAPLVSYANVLVVNKDLPFKNVADLLAYAEANPGKLGYGSAGTGASNHLSGELMAAQSQTQLMHVPYKGNAPAMTDVIGGQIGMMFDIVSTARSYVASGRVRALAVTSRERNPSLPDVPTMREAGLPNFEVVGWFGLYAPPKLPPALAARYAEAARKALASDDLKVLWNEHGYDRWPGSAETMATQASRERAMWGTVTKGINVE
ncbi:tripartite tricarboxylate transporter substrate binding protein [Caenimonas sedimenti]|uniref:Tripartite tricarboxylate transporter substrate binding protein n=1 Tax=Caenimonas sedimenti TaxID=2596921 RepID=A0A562ZXN7_9BURK|nr:tripartite tricarboxylate transporter substrate binding protein [Caenimonas sedimenti]TWO73379.1 tripartite tricarboxylate transporter substrate binding protein [Caenimonas sedimenti]